MVRLTCTKLVQGQRRAAGIEIAAVMAKRLCAFQMNQLGNFMRIVVTGQLQNIPAFQHQSVEIAAMQPLGLFSPDTQCLAQRAWEAPEMAKICLTDNS
ncbi:hypothetical protein D3C80_1723650 [compost metagenome]